MPIQRSSSERGAARVFSFEIGSMNFCHRVCIPAVLLIALSDAAAFGQAIGGVYIDPDGVLRQTSSLGRNEQLELLRTEAVDAVSNQDVGRTSKFRCVSLKQLEQTAAELSRQGTAWPAELRYMAGLQTVTHIFFFPEQYDVVLAGPAEAWTQLPTGEVVGRTSGRPVLHLDDLIVGLRYAMASRKPAPFIGCSIEPTAQGMQNYVAYMNNLGTIDRNRIQQIFTGMARAMGMQAIRLYGIAPDSRFAQTIVAADYRLKRICLGHDPSPVKSFTNYLDLAAKGSSRAAQKQHRWWFVAEYDFVEHTADELAWELKGQGVKVVTASNLPGTAEADAEKPTRAARQVADTFTRNFPAMSKKIPVFAELQNAIGLAVVAELVAGKQRDQPADNWRPDFFLNAEACRLREYHVPTEVPSISDYRYSRGRGWITSVSGGVELSPARVVGPEFRQQTDDRTLPGLRASTERPATAESWWWDTKPL